jgi:hypothetical protein
MYFILKNFLGLKKYFHETEKSFVERKFMFCPVMGLNRTTSNVSREISSNCPSILLTNSF